MTFLRIATLLSFMALSACNEDLYTQLDERQANEMVAVLTANGIGADRHRDKKGLYAVAVSKGDVGPAIVLLNSAGLPRERFQSIGDVFADDGVVGTPFEERARFIYALSQELAHTLTDIAGVEKARVHIIIPERARLDRDAEPSRASVALYHSREFDSSMLVGQVKTLVTFAVPGLAYDDVAVALFPASGLENIDLVLNSSSGAAFASMPMGKITTVASSEMSDRSKVLALVGLVGLSLFLILYQISRKLRGLFRKRLG